MKKLMFLATLGVALLLGSSAQAQNVPAGFDEYCKKTFDEWNLPSMTVVVVKDGEVVYLKGFGKTRLDSAGVDVDPVTTQYVICSTSKAFTGALLATVIDDYDVKWNDPVIKHLPDFKLYDEWATKNMQVQEVNTHHTGWKTYAMDDLPMFGYDRDDLYHIFSQIQPTYSFRTTYAYNNEMYTVSAKIIEKYTGMKWEDAIEERIYKPLKMTHSTTGNKSFFTSKDLAYGYNVRYDWDKGKMVPHYRDDRQDGFVWMSAVAPAAFVQTTAADLGNWLKMHLNHGVFEGDTIISRKNHDRLFYPQTITSFNDERVCTYGQGWTVEQSRKCRFIRHTGLAYGYTSIVGFVPDLKMGIAVLTTNGSTSDPQEGIARKLIDLYLGIEDGPDYAHKYLVDFQEDSRPEKKEDKPKEEFVAAQPAKAYIGTYFLDAFGEARVYEKNGELWFSLKKVDSPLKHKNADKFSFHVDGAGNFDLTFKMKGGKAQSLTFNIGDPIGDFVRR
ncbi:MAG: serine hydrolase [Bacteroidales bacterium]|nr:serine hydrolase [Candidatus Cacconaster caballi]